MSESSSDGSLAIPSLAVEAELGLSDISERDEVWDKHKAHSDRVANAYAGSEFGSYSVRINFCSDLLEFKVAVGDSGRSGLKLSSARFCRVRHCPVCQWRRSLMWKAKAYKMIPRVVEAYPTYRWLFLTLTVRNCPITDLKKTLAGMNKGFTRLTQLKVWPAEGWIKSIEVTRGRDGSAHPHFHCLLMVPPSFFSRNYINQAEWSELWHQCMRLDYEPVVHVRAIKKTNDPRVIVPEILKYQTKESDLVADVEWLRELTRQLHKTRAVAVGGVLRSYLKELEDEPEDLIGEGDEKSEVDDFHLFFGWRSKQKKYLLVNN